MNRKPIATISGTKFYFAQSAVISSIILWIIFAAICIGLLSWDILIALIFSTLALILYWVGGILHHIGHIIAAKQAGYPMEAVRLWMLIGTDIYPKDEPELPADTHLYRAIGGPIFSLGMAFVGLLLTFFLQPFGEFAIYLALFFAAVNFFVYCLGALLPLGFTDGSTILKYWRLREK